MLSHTPPAPPKSLSIKTWYSLGTFTFKAGTGGSVFISNNANGRVVADAVKFVTPDEITPPGYTGTDIGAVSVAGSALASGDVYTIEAAGMDIAGTADQFHYIYKQVSRDVEIIARVNSIANTSNNAKAGVMIKSSLADNSPNVFMAVTRTGSSRFQTRLTTGGTTTAVTGTAALSYWVKLVRRYNTFYGYLSADGTSWTYTGKEKVPMGSSVYIGLAATSARSQGLTRAVLDNVSINSLVPYEKLLIDNTDVEFSLKGAWSAGTTPTGFYGTNYYYRATGTGANRATWNAFILNPGIYKISGRWAASSNRASDAKYTINHAGGATTVTVDQRVNGGEWVSLGKFNFAIGDNGTVVLTDKATGTYVVADAVKWELSANSPPVWTSIPQQSATEDLNFSFNLASYATDADGDSLMFNKISGPAWLSVSAGGMASGIPVNSDVGAGTLVVEANDSNGGTASANISIAVINVNDAPQASNGTLSINEDAGGSVTLNGTDVDAGDTLTYSVIQGAYGSVTISGNVATYTPNLNYNGTDQFIYTVKDSLDASDTAVIHVTVNPVNDDPVWEAVPEGIATTDQEFSYDVSGYVTDVDSDNLTFSKVASPEWINITTEGVIQGLPTSSDVGQATIDLIVADGHHEVPSQIVVVVVKGIRDNVLLFEDFTPLVDNFLSTTGDGASRYQFTNDQLMGSFQRSPQLHSRYQFLVPPLSDSNRFLFSTRLKLLSTDTMGTNIGLFNSTTLNDTIIQGNNSNLQGIGLSIVGQKANVLSLPGQGQPAKVLSLDKSLKTRPRI